MKCFWFLTFLLSFTFWAEGSLACTICAVLNAYITILLTVERRVGINKVKLTIWVMPSDLEQYHLLKILSVFVTNRRLPHVLHFYLPHVLHFY